MTCPPTIGLLVRSPPGGLDPLRGLCAQRRTQRRHLARLDPGGGTGARHSAAARFPSLEFARGPPLLGDACAPGHAGAGAAPAVGPVFT